MTGATAGDDLSTAGLVQEAVGRVRGPNAMTAGPGAGEREIPFTANLDLLVKSCLQTAGLNATGMVVLHKTALRHLRNLLDLDAYLEARPEVATRPLEAPVVVTGLPRTGTTLLHNLLALDPRHRALRFWEALRPVPRAPGAPPPTEPPAAKAERWLDAFYRMVPGFKAIHAATPEGPEECDALLQNSFASQHFDDMFDARGYSAWLAGAPLRAEYDHYAMQLRALSESSAPGTSWALKSPSHLGHLDALLDALPGVTVVVCHRHPREAVASWASLVYALRQAYSDEVSSAVVGRQALDRAAAAMQRALDVRAAAGDGDAAFVDVAYDHLVSDPVAAVRAVYRRRGRTLDATVEDAVRGWADANPAHRHGPHRYDLARFDLTADEVNTAFGPYLERFHALVGD